MRPKAFISGPMTGIPDSNYPAFIEARQELIGKGYNVLSPHTINGGRQSKPRWFFMRESMRMLVMCDCIVMLPGWLESTGARLEYEAAIEFEMPIYDATDEPEPNEVWNDSKRIKGVD